MRAKLGEVEFSVVEADKPTYSNTITEKPVERGQDIADHVKVKPIMVSINGVVTGDDAATKLQKLVQYRDQGTILNYVNRMSASNVVIENLSTIHDASVRNGFAFSIILKHVRIAIAKTVEIKNPSIAKQTKSTTNKGVQQPKKVETTTSTKSNSMPIVGYEKAKSDLNKILGSYVANNNLPGPRMATSNPSFPWLS